MANTRGAQLHALEQQEEREQQCLMASQQPLVPTLANRLFRTEREHADLDVGIACDVVRVGVVTVVLVLPPRRADRDEHGARREEERVVLPPGPEDLTVCGVME